MRRSPQEGAAALAGLTAPSSVVVHAVHQEVHATIVASAPHVAEAAVHYGNHTNGQGHGQQHRHNGHHVTGVAAIRQVSGEFLHLRRHWLCERGDRLWQWWLASVLALLLVLLPLAVRAHAVDHRWLSGLWRCLNGGLGGSHGAGGI